MYDREGYSAWPASMRKYDCTFVGWPRTHGSRILLSALKKHPFGRRLKCHLSVQRKFRREIGPYSYQVHYLSTSKIGFCPRGTGPETMRFAEVLGAGTVPAMLPSNFHSVTFSRFPGVIASSWPKVFAKIGELLKDPERLDEVQEECVKWYRRLRECERAGIDVLLRHALTDK